MREREREKRNPHGNSRPPARAAPRQTPTIERRMAKNNKNGGLDITDTHTQLCSALWVQSREKKEEEMRFSFFFFFFHRSEWKKKKKKKRKELTTHIPELLKLASFHIRNEQGTHTRPVCVCVLRFSFRHVAVVVLRLKMYFKNRRGIRFLNGHFLSAQICGLFSAVLYKTVSLLPAAASCCQWYTHTHTTVVNLCTLQIFSFHFF